MARRVAVQAEPGLAVLQRQVVDPVLIRVVPVARSSVDRPPGDGGRGGVAVEALARGRYALEIKATVWVGKFIPRGIRGAIRTAGAGVNEITGPTIVPPRLGSG